MRVSINGHYLRRRVSGLSRYSMQVDQFLRECSLHRTVLRLPAIFYRPGGRLVKWSRFIALLLMEMLLPPLLLAMRRVDAHVSPAFAAPLPWYSSRMVVVFHDLAFVEFPHLYSRLERAYLKLNLWLLRHGRHRIVTPSEFVRQQFCAHTGIPHERVLVISPYCEFSPGSAQHSPASPYLLLLSNAHPRKNLAATIEAFVRSDAPAQGIDLLIVGNFELPVASRHPQVLVRQGVDDAELRGLLAAARALLLFSFSEGFGYPVVEAAHLGVLSITSEAGSLAEFVGDGRLPEVATDCTQITRRINRFLNDPDYRTSLEASRRHVCTRYGRAIFNALWKNLLLPPAP
jgi:glycosyltransferase involved in cell wall biosynthesis